MLQCISDKTVVNSWNTLKSRGNKNISYETGFQVDISVVFMCHVNVLSSICDEC